MTKTWFIQFIADYGTGDPAFGEVIQKLRFHYPELQTHAISVSAFDTLATGFWISQYALGEQPPNQLIYANTAPRKDRKNARQDNEGEILMYAQLKNNAQVMAVNAGYSFSFIKPYIEEFRLTKVSNKGSQFRSRDFYPKLIGSFLKGEEVLGERVEIKHIPEVPNNRVVWVDGYGNMKTSIRKSKLDLALGSKIKISINNVVRTALVAGGNFSVAEGELSFSPGSSGYEDPFYELFLRGGSAYQLFAAPNPGAEIELIGLDD